MNSQVAVGGGIPILINGLKYGSVNVYKPGAPENLPATGDVNDADMRYLLQKSSSGYAIQNNEYVGKSIFAYNSKTGKIMLIVQEDGQKGMTLDQIRDNLIKQGYDNAISFDGSNSATLVQDQQTLVTPGLKKNATIPSGITISER